MDYRSRCSVMESCLPISEFKHQTVKLHVDMLNEIESLRAKLAEAEKYRELYENIKATAATTEGFGYQCIKCGHLYNVINLGDSEDCPVCGCDGTISAAIEKGEG